jgi:hypothetical protein
VAATSGVTLGGTRIKTDGSWDGNWKTIDKAGKFSITVPAASAVIVKLTRTDS